MIWQTKKFNGLTAQELYEILELRAEVFVVEQNCPYQDVDGKDKYAYHLMGYDEAGVLVAYCRLLPVGISYPNDTSIGRVASKFSARTTGVGMELMQKAMEMMQEIYPNQSIRISAQSYLVRFYEKFGFVSTEKEYLEDDIPHTEMVFG
jgi:ElaA protein